MKNLHPMVVVIIALAVIFAVVLTFSLLDTFDQSTLMVPLKNPGTTPHGQQQKDQPQQQEVKSNVSNFDSNLAV